jgi:hypothetical protein
MIATRPTSKEVIGEESLVHVGSWVKAGLRRVLREIREEIGAAVRVRPLGSVHVCSFYYDANCPSLISIAYLVAYEGGAITAGDDMRGSTIRWMTRADIDAAAVKLLVPRDQKWVLHRAVDLYRLWKNEAVDLQPALDATARSKYAL